MVEEWYEKWTLKMGKNKLVWDYPWKMAIAKAVSERAVAKSTFKKSPQYTQICKENNIIETISDIILNDHC